MHSIEMLMSMVLDDVLADDYQLPIIPSEEPLEKMDIGLIKDEYGNLRWSK